MRTSESGSRSPRTSLVFPPAAGIPQASRVSSRLLPLEIIRTISVCCWRISFGARPPIRPSRRVVSKPILEPSRSIALELGKKFDHLHHHDAPVRRGGIDRLGETPELRSGLGQPLHIMVGSPAVTARAGRVSILRARRPRGADPRRRTVLAGPAPSGRFRDRCVRISPPSVLPPARRCPVRWKTTRVSANA
jgi:hypothetical protein